ncbi:hypothetical protein ABIB73_003350 [Bradyrhizobium sp. F1.4.3]|uniref:hypothetical protein n=1 Tax=Bradyrhizobium sp. F1.4.3 TaxID=3156356 RepID=UPI00339AA77F
MRIAAIRVIDAVTIAVLWLTARKQPGKICRQAAVSLLKANGDWHRSKEIYSTYSIV